MKLCIVGTGYVGLVSAACFAEMGNSVTCIDVNKDVVARLNAGSVHIFEPGLEPMVRRSHADGRLKFTTSLAEGLVGADCAFICVGTPPGEDGSCDLHYVEQVAREIGRTMENDLIVVDKSTVPVGTADRVRAIITEELAARGKNFDFEVVSNPEFLKEGDAISDFMKPDRVVIGTSSDKAAATMRELYAPFARTRDKLIVMGIRSAEMTKYAAISTTPTNRDATIQRIQLVQTGPHTAMLVLTTSTGAVKSKLFRTNYLLNSDILRMFSNVLNEKMGSVHLLNVTPDFIKSTAFSIGELSLMMAPVFVALGQACREVLKTNVLLEGRTNLLYLPEYEVDSVKRLLHFLEQRGELAKLIGAQKEKLGVLIGGESNQPEMIDTSVVLVRYSMGRQTRGTLGVIGPTRMDYPKIVSNLQYLAQSVGGMLNEIMDVGV